MYINTFSIFFCRFEVNKFYLKLCKFTWQHYNKKHSAKHVSILS